MSKAEPKTKLRADPCKVPKPNMVKSEDRDYTRHVDAQPLNTIPDQDPNVANPYWPEYQQPSQSSGPLLNFYASPAQHGYHIATSSSDAGIAASQDRQVATSQDHQVTAPRDRQVDAPMSAPAGSLSPAQLRTKSMNPNQVHAQSYPWRIKVYNACLACRKKKIKCDGQPTCQRCQRLGLECSYVEVPQTPHGKSSKQKQKSLGAAVAPTLGPTSGIDPDKGQKHHSTNQQQASSSSHPSRNNAVEAAKEIRQQRRSSTQDAASGSFPHTRRKKDLTPSKDLFVDKTPPTPSVAITQTPSSSASQLRQRSMGKIVMDRDSVLPDLYHILVNSVTVPAVNRFSQTTSQQTSSLLASPAMDTNQLNFPLATIPTDLMNPDQNHPSSFQKDPMASSFLDQPTPLGFVITNTSVIQYLVHVYFECFHPHWMIVDKEIFLARLKDANPPPDPLLLVAICAAGAKYSDHDGLCVEPGNLSTIGEQFLTHARILLQDRFDMPSVSTLQALLILYWCQVQTGRASLRFIYVGMAIRMAQEMGLNKPLDPRHLKDMDEREIEIRKTIWWSCYQADRWTSAALGKPMVISDVDCLVDYPKSLNVNEEYQIQSFRHMTDLTKILGKIILNLYTATNAATCSSAVFSYMDQALSTWFESMPTPPSTDTTSEASQVAIPINKDSAKKSSSTQQQRSNSESSTPAMDHPETSTSAPQDSVMKPEPDMNTYCALLFHTVRIMLYRPFLHNSALTPVFPRALQSPQIRCHESAVAISEIAEDMILEQRSYRQLFNSLHISLCVAASVHRFAIITPMALKAPSQNNDRDAMNGSLQLNLEGEPMSSVLDAPATVMSTPPTAPSTLSKAPSSAKSDLYYLTLLLRILLHCGRFSIAKSVLRSVVDEYLPHRYLKPQEIGWALEEISRPLKIIPFAIRLPTQTPVGNKAVVVVNSESSSVRVDQQQQQMVPQQQQQPATSPRAQMLHHQHYQQRLRQHQQEQQQSKRLDQARRINPPPPPTVEDMMNSSTHHNPSLGTLAPDCADEIAFHQGGDISDAGVGRSTILIRSSSISVAADGGGGNSHLVNCDASSMYRSNLGGTVIISEHLQLQQHQQELDMLQEQHIRQQYELNKRHQRQSLELERAQLCQQIQQQQQQQQALCAHQQQSSNIHAPAQQNRSSGTVLDGDNINNNNNAHSAAFRNKRHSELSPKKKQAKQQQFDQQQQQQQQNLQSIFMTKANSTTIEAATASVNAGNMDPALGYETLDILTSGTGARIESGEIMTNNSAPPGNEYYCTLDPSSMRTVVVAVDEDEDDMTSMAGNICPRPLMTNVAPDSLHHHSPDTDHYHDHDNDRGYDSDFGYDNDAMDQHNAFM
ncbi:hypothetical protein BG011_001885 [Mortierella polycephala]|uniref:Zn(2)-C6 fungal-type domain-containing protein n=1 Tax=Mortierella polycephala TaxID=41804 RepID=A0A9P6Q6J4_9FUNG|nr:hypothetical protein BG011_001885 [Mortierella polycephala]